MNIKVIILDFDGVILESVGIKDRAFGKLFENHPQHLPQIMEYHLSNNATIRFDKFKYIYENILHLTYNDEIEKKLSKQFSGGIVDQIIRCPYVAGAHDFLEDFVEKMPLYLVSVNPPEELGSILASRDLARYFKDVYAHPWRKQDAILDILKREDILTEEAVFIGDSVEDYRAALASDVPFIGRDSRKSFGDADVDLYKDFFEIKKTLADNGAVYEKGH